MQPPSVTRATLASGAPLTRAVTVTAAPGRTVSVSPGPAVAVPSSLDEVRRRKVLRVRDCLRPPDRFTRRVRVAAAHHEAAVRPHPLGVGGEDAIARCVPPVNPAARRQRDRQPMPVAGGDLLTCDDLQAVVLGCCPGPVGGVGVVVGGDDEVKAGRRGGRGHLGDPPPAVGMHCVRVQIAAIPTRSTIRSTAGFSAG